MSFLSFFFFSCYGAHRDLHSFPTRRSSDLSAPRHRPHVEPARCNAASRPACPGPRSTPAPRDPRGPMALQTRSEEHTSELQSQSNLVCRLLLEKKKKNNNREYHRDRNNLSR